MSGSTHFNFMKLYFMRHADALDGMEDAIRPLSPRGKEEAQRVARFLKQAGIPISQRFGIVIIRC